jgi:hypothetical protein
VRKRLAAACSARVDHTDRFDQKAVSSPIGDRGVLHAAGHDERLARTRGDVGVPELDGDFTADDNGQLIGVLVAANSLL